MRMPVMDVRVVRMLVRHAFVAMRMRVGLLAIPFKAVLVLVVVVMAVAVSVLETLVRMFMLMPLAHVQPHAERHECRRQPEQSGRHLRPNGQ